jgi:hypothetical protein
MKDIDLLMLLMLFSRWLKIKHYWKGVNINASMFINWIWKIK